jgi:hypothetical protein
MITNSIIWGNYGNGIYLDKNALISITYSNIEGGYSGIGNINTDPLFVDPRPAFEAPTSDGYYHLQPGSLCIDSANSDPPAMDKDRNGFLRYDDPDTEPNIGTGVNGDYYDMGAYEYQGTNTHPSVIIDSPNGGEFWSENQSILWTATDAEQTEINALLATLYYGNSISGPWTPLVHEVPCTSGVKAYYNWNTTLVPEETYWIRINISDGLWGNGEDISDASFIVDNNPPDTPTISSPTHPEDGNWYIDNDLVFIWTEPNDVSGINGYSYILDNSPNTNPDTEIESSEATINYNNVADGIWYFHIKALDGMGNWGETAHYNVNIRISPIIRRVPGEYSSIHVAIDASSDGDIILVANGTYYENIDFLSKAITIQSENGPIHTIIDGSGITTVVKFNPNLGKGAKLNGFTITNGSNDSGGGIFCDQSSPEIKNCIITNNSAYTGGGIYCNNSSSPQINNCFINNNNGGGIHCNNLSSPTITNCTIKDNSAGNGGGIYLRNSSNASITNCSIKNNSVSSGGGGIYIDTSAVSKFTNNIISGNSSRSGGGGIFCRNAFLTLTNCFITGNSAHHGAGIRYLSSSTRIINCTFSGNSASWSGGGFYNQDTSLVIINSIFWGNKDNESSNEFKLYGPAFLDITYSNIKGGWMGNGNINTDPQFVDPRPASEAPTIAGNYHLKTGSPCIDAGDPASHSPDFPAEDIEGDIRPQGTHYDMGADEYAGCADRDGDGYYAEEGCNTEVDCDDNDKNINPGASEACDGKDNDCIGGVPVNEADGDGDGSRLCHNDCDDGDPDRFPGNPETCDGIDNDCNDLIDDSASCTISISLNAGWNLISLRQQPLNTAIGDVLGTVSASCNSVWAFNNGWTAYYPSFPEYSDLATMGAGWGYWLNMSASTTMIVTGSTPSGTISLNEGWNLVGCNLPTPVSIADAIGSIVGDCESVWAYIDGEWKAYYPAFPEYSDLQTMEPHYGYWIKTTQACDWTLP